VGRSSGSALRRRGCTCRCSQQSGKSVVNPDDTEQGEKRFLPRVEIRLTVWCWSMVVYRRTVSAADNVTEDGFRKRHGSAIADYFGSPLSMSNETNKSFGKE